MVEKEIEDYIKTQRCLGVKAEDIRKSLLDAGYSEDHFGHVLAKHAKRPRKEHNLTTSHILGLNIAVIIIFGLLFAYVSYDYNTKLQDLAVKQEQQVNDTAQKLKTQADSLSSLKTQTASTTSSLSTDITQAKSKIDAVNTDLTSKLQTYNYQSLSRDSSLSDSIQKMSNQSLTELSGFSKQLATFRKASVDFSPVIPKAVSSVVTIGRKGAGFFTTSGSGVFINNKSYIVTNWHVVDDLKKIDVKTSDNKDFTAKLVGRNEDWDVAVIKLDTKQQNFKYLEFADSGQVSVGDHVIAIGNPVGFDSTVTEGIISNTKRLITREEDIYYLQTDVAINAGNSGGPLIDKKGNIVGIATLKYAQSGFEGLSFALRSNDVQRVVLEILQKEAIP